MNDIQGFFTRLFAHAPVDSKVNLFRLPSARSEHLPPDPSILAARALELDAQASGSDGVFFVVCPLRDGLTAYQKGEASDVVQVAALWADIDFAHPTHASKNLPPDLISAFSLISDAGIPDPSILVSSGAGLQPYWILEEPLSPEQGRALASALHDRIKAAADARGWHLDNVVNLDRVLRVPGTHNRKDPLNPRKCELLEVSDVVYKVSQLVPSAGDSSTAAPSHPRLLGSSSPPHGDESPVEVARMPPEDAQRYVLNKMRGASGERTKVLAALILKGLPLELGQRDNDLIRATGLVASFTPDGSTAEDVVEILYPTIDATISASPVDPKNPPPDRDAALKKLRRSLANWRKQQADKKAGVAAMSRGLMRAARASARSPHDDPEEDVPDGPYTPDELHGFELEHGAPLQWIVQRQGAHYVLVGGKYQGPIATSDVSVRFKESLAPAPLDLTVYEGNRARPLSTQETLDKYSTNADRIIADLTLTSGRYDKAQKTFFEAACSVRTIRPIFNPQIDRWLRIMGGKLAEKLIDWVASVTRLDRQCAALYLSKTSNTGKTVLAQGLSRIWSDGGPTSLKNIVGSWNSDLVRCPLVVADEYLPREWLEKGRGTASSELRELVASDSRALTRKFLPNTDLRGCIRIMLLANDKSMIPYDEQLGSADIEAIAGRFLTIHTPPEAAEYLQAIGGRDGGMRDWVDGDGIAAHALWLRDNRQVVSGSRFIVEGIADDTQRKLVYGTKIGGLVCEVIVGLLSASRPMGQGGAPAIRVGGGRLLVSTPGISAEWKNYVSSDQVASTQKIGRQLSVMSAKKGEKVKGQPYHVVNPEYVFGWAEENYVGDVDFMRSKIETLPPVLGLVEGGKDEDKEQKK